LNTIATAINCQLNGSYYNGITGQDVYEYPNYQQYDYQNYQNYGNNENYANYEYPVDTTENLYNNSQVVDQNYLYQTYDTNYGVQLDEGNNGEVNKLNISTFVKENIPEENKIEQKEVKPINKISNKKSKQGDTKLKVLKVKRKRIRLIKKKIE
jgi:hypothetical protein